MATFYEAIEAIKPQTVSQTENVYILEALNRVLAEDVISDIDFPPFNKATMDGFAYRVSDGETFSKLRVIDSLPAGVDKQINLGPRECVRIMTGAIVPEGCNSVVEFESVIEKEGYIEFKKPPKPNQNIAYLGEDLKKGELALSKYKLIKPQMINLLAQLGKKEVKVFRKLKIGVITTGDELVDIGEPKKASNVIDTSRYSLIAQITGFNQEPIDYGRIGDDEKIITRVLNTAPRECDIVLITGGSSFGDKDYTAKALEAVGAKIVIRTIDMKPGHPTIIAQKGNVWIVGSPGNPVSTFSVFRLFVGDIVSKMLNCDDFKVKIYEAKLDFDYKKKADRMHFLPVFVEYKTHFLAKKINYNGSGDFAALSLANAFLVVPKETKDVASGEILKFFFI